MKTKLLSTLALTVILSSTAFSANAQTRTTEVNTRVENQETRVDAGVDDGTITAKQAARDEKVIERVETQQGKYEAKNGGTITKKEQVKMNKELNHNSKRIKRQRAN